MTLRWCAAALALLSGLLALVDFALGAWRPFAVDVAVAAMSAAVYAFVVRRIKRAREPVPWPFLDGHRPRPNS